jgi:hypothetical protein
MSIWAVQYGFCRPYNRKVGTEIEEVTACISEAELAQKLRNRLLNFGQQTDILWHEFLRQFIQQ